MRHSSLIATLTVLFILASVSCAKKEATGEGYSDNVNLVSGTILVQDAPFFADQTSGNPVWDRALDFGTEIQVDSSATTREYTIGSETMILVSASIKTGGGAVRGWVRRGHVTTVKAKPAAVIARSAKVSDGSSGTITVLSRLALVVTDENSGSGDASMVAVYLNDPSDKNAVIFGYMPKDTLTYNKSDVASAVLIAAALAARDEQDRNVLLDKALRLHGDAVFAGDIAVLKGTAPDESQTGPACESLLTTLTVKTDAAEVRDAPEAKATVVGTLAFDGEASVIERTVEQYDAGKGPARWYHLDGPIAGWIHGTDLEGAD